MGSETPSPVAGLRVLVVEDEYYIALNISGSLEDLGCDVLGPVATIEEALAIVRSERLDGVLLDANLKGVSSTPVATELRARVIPFIVVTGYGRLELEPGVLNAAPRLGKPFDVSELKKLVAATFLARRAQ